MLGAVSLCSLVLLNPAHGLGEGQGISVNPRFAFPGEHTSPGAGVDSAALVENANAWNGRQITFTGEAIGESMVRGEMAWIHVNDDPYMEKGVGEGAPLGGYNSGHAIWIPVELARRIVFFGDCQNHGDIIRITGTFNSACREHGGDMDIHAVSLEVVHPGRPLARPINMGRAAVAAALFVLAGILSGLRQGARRRRI